MVTGSSVAGIITAIATMLTALGGLLLAVKVIIPTHKLVNQRYTDLTQYIKALVGVLEKHDIEVPKDQSKLD
jgi:hypothetical protein